MFSLASKNIFVKGFVKGDLFKLVNPEECGGQLSVVITDLTTTKVVKIDSATKDGNSWTIICQDGKSYTIEQEPDIARQVEGAIVIKDYSVTICGAKYDYVTEDEYEEAIKKDNIANLNYRIIGRVNGAYVVTGPLVKLWEENQSRHGITKSGTHYSW